MGFKNVIVGAGDPEELMVIGRFSMGRLVLMVELEDDRCGCCTCTDDIWTKPEVVIFCAAVVEKLVEKDGFSTTGIDDKCETETEIGGMGTLVGGIALELDNWEDESIPSTLTSGP